MLVQQQNFDNTKNIIDTIVNASKILDDIYKLVPSVCVNNIFYLLLIDRISYAKYIQYLENIETLRTASMQAGNLIKQAMGEKDNLRNNLWRENPNTYQSNQKYQDALAEYKLLRDTSKSNDWWVSTENRNKFTSAYKLLMAEKRAMTHHDITKQKLKSFLNNQSNNLTQKQKNVVAKLKPLREFVDAKRYELWRLDMDTQKKEIFKSLSEILKNPPDKNISDPWYTKLYNAIKYVFRFIFDYQNLMIEEMNLQICEGFQELIKQKNEKNLINNQQSMINK